MAPLIERVRETLVNNFPGADVELELVGPQKRVFGTIAWMGFEEQDHTERQSQVWKVLEAVFTQAELMNVFGVLTFLPVAMADKDF